MQWPLPWDLRGEEGAAWAQAYLSAVAIVISVLIAVGIPMLDRHRKRAAIRRAALHAIVDALGGNYALWKTYATSGIEKFENLAVEIALAQIQGAQFLLNEIPAAELQAWEGMAAIADVRSELLMLERIIGQGVPKTAEECTTIFKGSFERMLISYERFRLTAKLKGIKSKAELQRQFPA